MRAPRLVSALVPALLTAALVVTAASSASAGPPSAATAPDARVRLTGTLLATAVERPGDKQWFAVREGRRIVPVTGASLPGITPGSTVALDVTVPAPITTAAASDRVVTVPGLGGRTVQHDLSPSDLQAASDSTPAPADSPIGRATTDSPRAPGAAALPVVKVVKVTQALAAYTPATRSITYVEVTPRGDTPSPVTSTQARTQVSAVDSFWSDNSRATVRLGVPTVKPALSSPYSCSDSPFNLWFDIADRVGWELAANSSLVLKIPLNSYDNSGCSWGLGTLGDSPNSGGMVYTATLGTQTVAHEIGHNMSFGHANALSCRDAALSTSGTWSGCSEMAYGDGIDVMGPDTESGTPMLSSPQALTVGTLESSAAATVGTGSTTVTLKPMSGRAGVRVARVTNAQTGALYYVEYRTAAGRDALATPRFGTGVKVLRYNPAQPSSVLLDPTPNGFMDGDATLHPGASLTSYDGKVVFTTISATSTEATVRIVNNATLAPFVLTSSPTITGTKGVGKTLTASKGTWSPTPSSYTYRWRRNGANISGATRSTYVPTQSDAGRYLTVTVTAKRTGYTSKSATSARAGIPIYATTRPYLKGTMRAGQTLTVMVGAWTPKPSTYTYKWYRDGVAKTGQTAKTYTLNNGDKGKQIHAKVTVRRTGYVTGSMTTPRKTVAR
ncbi:MAG: hypothetical protein L0G89_07930 [Janibacter sp.]|nr:hypothetical protein [Janibacter sp.]